jgi:hypothetical protein
MPNTIEKPERVERIALPAACSELRMSRDQVIHRINTGQLEGGQLLGRWYVARAAIDAALADAAAAASQAA